LVVADELPIADDPTIQPHDVVYRRVKDGGNISIVLDATGKRKASSSAFEDDLDGISVFLHSALVSAGLMPVDVINGFYGYVLACIIVLDVRDLGMGVIRDPDPSDAKPMACNVAHCLLTLPKLPKRQNHRLRQRIASVAILME
jgi:hypothetical protein